MNDVLDFIFNKARQTGHSAFDQEILKQRIRKAQHFQMDYQRYTHYYGGTDPYGPGRANHPILNKRHLRKDLTTAEKMRAMMFLENRSNATNVRPVN